MSRGSPSGTTFSQPNLLRSRLMSSWSETHLPPWPPSCQSPSGCPNRCLTRATGGSAVAQAVRPNMSPSDRLHVELEALIELVGEPRARQQLEGWIPYTWVYRTVLMDTERL